MSESIKAGDLVRVAKDCCGHWVGRIFLVEDLFAEHNVRRVCPQCGAIVSKAGDAMAHAPDGGSFKSIPKGWLKRIPPLGELGDVKQDEVLHA